MAEKISTGMRNWKLGGGSIREALEDCVMKIYSGTPPDSADDAASGTLLVTITKDSGTVATTERSTWNRWGFLIATGHTEGNTVAVNITIDGVGPTTYTYTILAEDTTDEKVAEKVARMLDDVRPLRAICVGSVINARTVVLQPQVKGIAMVVEDGGGDYAIAVAEIEVGSRSDALYFGAPSSGSMSKSTDTWSGTIANSGTAGYFRFVRPDDDGTESTTAIRIQGAIATSGAEYNIANLSLTATQTHTVDDYSITEPAE